MYQILIHCHSHRRPGATITPIGFETYPGGEVRLASVLPRETGHVVARLENSDSIQALAHVAEYYQNRGGKMPSLFLPYVPYARQDRRENVLGNQSLTLKVFAQQLNAMGWDYVEVIDPHSIVTPSLIDRVIVKNRVFTAGQFFARFNETTWRTADNTVLVAPDLGAAKAIDQISAQFRLPVMQALKHRDPETGVISHDVMILNPDAAPGKDLIIFDDICDGGRTFTTLLTGLRQLKPKSVHLVVTHGIFSKGMEPLAGFDTVSCMYPFTTRNQDRLVGWNVAAMPENETMTPSFWLASKAK